MKVANRNCSEKRWNITSFKVYRMGHADLEIGLEKSYITLKNVVMIMACIIKDGDKFYSQLLYCMSKKNVKNFKNIEEKN